MHKVWSSVFLFWFLLEGLLHVCFPYTVEKTTDSSGSRQLETSETSSMGQSRGFLSILRPTQVKIPAPRPTLKPSEFHTNKVSPHRPGLVHVISVSSIAFVVALLCGLMISYVIHRLVKAEEKQQLAMLYENVEIPLLEEKDSSEDESSQLDPENEELGKFIGSVIKTKIMENLRRK
uniref:Similar to human chromosome 19 open reading frame 18 n=1 Tax=Rattus norvegicus TaxID=10116 RepID=D4ADP8_RAT